MSKWLPRCLLDSRRGGGSCKCRHRRSPTAHAACSRMRFQGCVLPHRPCGSKDGAVQLCMLLADWQMRTRPVATCTLALRARQRALIRPNLRTGHAVQRGRRQGLLQTHETRHGHIITPRHRARSAEGHAKSKRRAPPVPTPAQSAGGHGGSIVLAPSGS